MPRNPRAVPTLSTPCEQGRPKKPKLTKRTYFFAPPRESPPILPADRAGKPSIPGYLARQYADGTTPPPQEQPT